MISGLMTLCRAYPLWIVLVAVGCDESPPIPPPATPVVTAPPVRDWSIPVLDPAEYQEPVAQAIEQARTNLASNPRLSKAWFFFAATLDAHKLYDEAERAYDNAVTLDPSDKFALYNYAMMLKARGDRQEAALAMFRRAAEVMGDYPPVWHHLAHVQMMGGEYDAARHSFELALAEFPESAMLHFDMGQTLITLGAVAEGITYLQRAAELVPGDAAIHASLSRAYAGLGETASARREADLAARGSLKLVLPDPVRDGIAALAMDSNSCLQRGARMMDSGRHADAIPDLQRAARYLTNNASLHLRLGICQYTTGQLDRARELLERTIELRDSMAQAHQILGRIEADEGRDDLAVERFRDAIEREPGNAGHHELLGSALLRLGRREAAIDAFREAVRLDPESTIARRRLEELGVQP